jgi:predicted RNA-binding Zn ribbon-like protein
MKLSATTGQWFESDGTRWWFDSGSVALDFSYTAGTAQGAPTADDAPSLSRWIGERFTGIDDALSPGDIVDARALRSSIASLAFSIARGEEPAAEQIDVINLYAATPDIPPSLAGGTRQAGRAHARVAQALSAMARESVALFGAESATCIRECAADDCELLFYDESRSNNRRWCSMQRCGNRAKVRAHRERN